MNKILFFCVIVLISCNNKPNNSDRQLSAQEKVEIQNINSIPEEIGLASLKTNCYACHNPNSESHDSMLAPPLAGIKFKYRNLYPEENLFIAQMSDFLINPTMENALMKGPVKRFGLMPKTILSKTEIQELVKYIYQSELEIPTWFPKHFKKQHKIKWDESEVKVK